MTTNKTPYRPWPAVIGPRADGVPVEIAPKANVSRISNELALMAAYIEVNPDNAISDTLWHGPAETTMDALLRLSEEVVFLESRTSVDLQKENEALRQSNAEFLDEINELAHNCNEFMADRDKLRKELDIKVKECEDLHAGAIGYAAGEAMTDPTTSARLQEAVALLVKHNKWRRGEDDSAMPSGGTNPMLLGQAIDTVALLVPGLINASQPNLQPLHDLVAEWNKLTLIPDNYDHFYTCTEELKVAIAKIQGAGEAIP